MKQGYDYFEKYRLPPPVTVCERHDIVDAVARSRPDPAGPCPPLARPAVTAFKPLPEPGGLDVARGNKLKGIADPDNEPTLADIKKAKERQSTQSAAVSSPVANAN